jgi:hypothetical protein
MVTPTPITPPPSVSPPPQPNTTAVQIIAPPLPPSNVATTLKGQITDVGPDNTVTLKTDTNVSVTIRLPRGAAPLAQGDYASITIPPTPQTPAPSSSITGVLIRTAAPVPSSPPLPQTPIQDNIVTTQSSPNNSAARQLRTLAAQALARVIGPDGTMIPPTSTQTTSIQSPLALRPLAWPDVLPLLRPAFAGTPFQNLIPPGFGQPFIPPSIQQSALTPAALTLPLIVPPEPGTVHRALSFLGPLTTDAPSSSTWPNMRMPNITTSPPSFQNNTPPSTTSGSFAPTSMPAQQSVFIFPPSLVSPSDLSSTSLSFTRAFEIGLTAVANTPGGTIIHAPETGRWFIQAHGGAERAQTNGTFTAVPIHTGGPVSKSLFPNAPEWITALQSILDLIDTLPSTTLRPVVPNTTAPHQLAAAVTLFAAAARMGDVSAILSENTLNTLRRAGKGTDLDTLTKLLSGAGKSTLGDGAPAAATSTAGEWRSFMFPLQFQGPVVPVTLYTKRLTDFEGQDESNDSTTGKNAGGQRFILDVSFDRMGAVQLDMLYRPGQLDSVLRTELPLSSAMRTVLSAKYASAMTRVSHTGALHFQDGAKAWVTVNRAPPPGIQTDA